MAVAVRGATYPRRAAPESAVARRHNPRGSDFLPQPPRLFHRRISVRFAAHKLDRRLAAGEYPFGDAALELRATRLLSARVRGQINRRLRGVLAEQPGAATLSSTIPADVPALEIGRPALEQLAAAIRS